MGLIIAAVQFLSRVRLSGTPGTAAHQVSPSFANSWSLLKLMSIELAMPSNHLILCRPLLLLPLHISLYTFSIASAQAQFPFFLTPCNLSIHLSPRNALWRAHSWLAFTLDWGSNQETKKHTWTLQGEKRPYRLWMSFYFPWTRTCSLTAIQLCSWTTCQRAGLVLWPRQWQRVRETHDRRFSLVPPT